MSKAGTVRTALPKSDKKVPVRRPGVEPGSIAWKATMLTVTPPKPSCSNEYMNKLFDFWITICMVGVEVLYFSVDSDSVCKNLFTPKLTARKSDG